MLIICTIYKQYGKKPLRCILEHTVFLKKLNMMKITQQNEDEVSTE